jgi:mRNA interferase RelE/StbE
MYEIEFSQSAEKAFLKLPNEVQKRIKSVLERARIRPSAHFERLVGIDAYKLRAGNYRIIADIQHDKLMILVIEVGHRRNIYR